jgi:hypothetical protein
MAHSAEDRKVERILSSIEALSQRERKRLGVLLSRGDYFPGWRLVQASIHQQTTDARLGPFQARLFELLQPLGSEHAESDLIFALWGEQVDDTTRARLRQVQKRTNVNLFIFSPIKLEIFRPRAGVVTLRKRRKNAWKRRY